MKRATCPSCGAPVVFRSSATVYVVCDFCRSLLLRSGDDLQDLGRMADLLPDTSRLQIGSEGTFRKRHFVVVGRIQLRYESGLWNEWHLLLDDGRSAWLAEAAGEYIVSAQISVRTPVPAFETLEPEMAIVLDGRRFVVSDLKTARCIAGEGELPFRVAAGYDVNTADLRSSDRFVTIDYSETPALVFVGHTATFAELQLENLKPVDDASVTGTTTTVRSFNCPHCAAPLTVHSPAIESVACDACGSIIGVDNENVKLLARATQALRETPWLPLGSQGRWREVDWLVIGFMRRSTHADGVDYSWSEYLLFHQEHGFAWLVESQGHWNFARTLANPPAVSRGQKTFTHHGKLFKLFNSSQAEVTYVVGEFYWRVAVGERCTVEDYVCPPLMLSREVSAKEATWSSAEYVTAVEVASAFGVKTPPPTQSGVYANQPNPLLESHRRVCRAFWQLALAATVVQFAFAFLFAAQLVLKQPLVLSPANEEATVNSREFVLGSRARALLVRHNTDVNNNWLSLTTTLVDKNTGESYQGEQEISYYHGVEDNESWSEGTPADDLLFRAIPAGTYYLVVEYELGTDNPVAVVDKLEVVRNPVAWSNFVLLLVFLAIFPLVSRWRRNAFETRRWRESDLGEKEEA